MGVNNTSSAYKYEQNYIPKYDDNLQIPQRKPNYEERAKQRRYKEKQKTYVLNGVKNIFTVLLCFAITFFIVFRYVTIIEASNKVESYKEELNELKRESEQFQAEIDSEIDLKNIEEIAREKLGMQPAEKYQIICVNVPKNDYVEVLNNKQDNNNSKGTIKIILDKIHQVLEYLN